MGYFSHNKKYALENLDEYGLLSAKADDCRMETNHKLAVAIDKDVEDPTQYWRIVQRLIYLPIHHAS